MSIRHVVVTHTDVVDVGGMGRDEANGWEGERRRGWWSWMWRRRWKTSDTVGDGVAVDGDTYFDALEHVRVQRKERLSKGWCKSKCSVKKQAVEDVPVVRKDPYTGMRHLPWTGQHAKETEEDADDGTHTTSTFGATSRKERKRMRALKRQEKRMKKQQDKARRRKTPSDATTNAPEPGAADAAANQGILDKEPTSTSSTTSPGRTFADLVAFLRHSFASARSGSLDWDELTREEEIEEEERAKCHVWPIPETYKPLGRRNSCLPKAKVGETLTKDDLDPERLDTDPKPSWSALHGREFRVRGDSYMSTKQKEPSEESLYVCVAADFYYASKKRDHVARSVELPDTPSDAWDAGVPPLMIVHLQVPVYAPSLFATGEGPGYSIVLYMCLREGTAEKAKTEPGRKRALDLLQAFSSQDTSKQRDRLKVVPRMINIEQCHSDGLLSNTEKKLLVAYREKPVLTRPQHRFYAGENYLEVCLDVHKYAYLARKGLHSFRPRIKHLVFDLGLVLQGNQKEELPEVMLGGVRLRGLDFTSQVTLEDRRRKAAEE